RASTRDRASRSRHGAARLACAQKTFATPSDKSVMIRKLKTGEYRLYSRKKNPKTGKRRNLGTFKSRAAAGKHEKAIQFFKRQ
ncbi:MAG: hypothetical protein ABIQ10_11250, partial [Gemmatimonadaceae bacterium]